MNDPHRRHGRLSGWKRRLALMTAALGLATGSLVAVAGLANADEPQTYRTIMRGITNISDVDDLSGTEVCRNIEWKSTSPDFVETDGPVQADWTSESCDDEIFAYVWFDSDIDENGNFHITGGMNLYTDDECLLLGLFACSDGILAVENFETTIEPNAPVKTVKVKFPADSRGTAYAELDFRARAL